MLCAVALADTVLAAVVLATRGAGEEGLLALNRGLVRVGFPLFALAFSASSLHALWPGTATRWLLARRRALGLGFALAHFAHGAAIVALFAASDRPLVPDATLVGGGIGFAFVALMAATSNDAAQRRLGARRWRCLHATGAWVVWSIFAFTYLGRVAEQGAAFLPGLGVCIAALGLRAAAALRRRSPRVRAA
jgi:DMSO/TMAO reductase YedYZ heme-binding membrane subunit